jgi:adenine phosphoribosyltransferase
MIEAPQVKAPEELRKGIRDVPDFPKKGILFKDITPLLADGALFQKSIEWFVSLHAGKSIDAVVGIDARGFIFAGAVAAKMGVGLIPVRKKGKLPYTTQSLSYSLEYGESELQIHTDAIGKGSNVIIVDDLLATGGTSLAAAKLIEKIGGRVASMDFLIELGFLNGRDKLQNYQVTSAIRY